MPNALSKSELASTINASIKTCLVLTSISLIILSTISKSVSFPLTITDLVVFSSVILIGVKLSSIDAKSYVKVFFASAGVI